MKDYSFYRRILPHWQPQGSILFVTSRLEGHLSKSVLEKIAINELSAKTIVHFSLEDNLKIQRETFRLFEQEMDKSS